MQRDTLETIKNYLEELADRLSAVLNIPYATAKRRARRLMLKGCDECGGTDRENELFFTDKKIPFLICRGCLLGEMIRRQERSTGEKIGKGLSRTQQEILEYLLIQPDNTAAVREMFIELYPDRPPGKFFSPFKRSIHALAKKGLLNTWEEDAVLFARLNLNAYEELI